MTEVITGTSEQGPKALLPGITGVKRTLPELEDEPFLQLGDAVCKLSR